MTSAVQGMTELCQGRNMCIFCSLRTPSRSPTPAVSWRPSEAATSAGLFILAAGSGSPRALMASQVMTPPPTISAALDDVGPGAGLEAARGDVDAGDDADDPAEDGDVVDGVEEAELDGGDADVGVEELGAEVGDKRDVDADEHDDHQQGHDGAGEGVEAELEVLRDGVDAALEEHGKEEETDADECDGGHPLVGGDGEADLAVGGGTGHADHLLGGDVGGDEGEADEGPGQAAPGEEVVAGGVFLAPGFPEADADDGGGEDDEDDDVDGLQVHGCTSVRHGEPRGPCVSESCVPGERPDLASGWC